LNNPRAPKLPAEEKRAFAEEVLRRCHSTPVRSPMKRSAPPQPPSGDRSTSKMATPLRGEVWLIAFGQAGKTRSALVVSVAFGDQDHATSFRAPLEVFGTEGSRRPRIRRSRGKDRAIFAASARFARYRSSTA